MVSFAGSEILLCDGEEALEGFESISVCGGVGAFVAKKLFYGMNLGGDGGVRIVDV